MPSKEGSLAREETAGMSGTGTPTSRPLDARDLRGPPVQTRAFAWAMYRSLSGVDFQRNRFHQEIQRLEALVRGRIYHRDRCQ